MTENTLPEIVATIAALEAHETAFAVVYNERTANLGEGFYDEWSATASALRAAYEKRDALEPVAYTIVTVNVGNGRETLQTEKPVYSLGDAQDLLASFNRLDGGAASYYYEIREEVRSLV